ncbi:iron hydrogenase [Clostridium sp. 'deep sea']|uniref:[Fe-Fe] hydrogenase large subunit C-terminal domain-containing protein n=1 Tax=Clostridium sp. 'deep sea' TaxID=2779445 RepID=UPI0018968FE6|nr:[Fe-Fe] hydrogenase large subunit C-terminal domain-containing protein [Clostridium sp. 'deep sea']QOR35464.1 iron hydrogenase [Clostridium sp. 'deep sea']
MVNKFKNFKEKRMAIFSELVSKYWNNELHNSMDLKELANDIKHKYNFGEEDMPFIRDHIRVAMGLNPTNENSEFTDELNLIKMNKVEKPIITKIEGACQYCDNTDCTCQEACKYEAHVYRKSNGPEIMNDKCLTCGQCISNCDFGALADKIEFLPLIDLLKDKKTKVFATVAPAIVGQFGDEVSMGQLRTALKLMGFEDMIEVALFADILTIKEAYEFNELVTSDEDFFLTSCCCPVWFNLTKRSYPKIFEHMSPSISPMIASGRFLKELYPDCKVVFIGPCVAKKAEAKAPELVGAIDNVLTFRELSEIFKSLNKDLAELPSEEKDQASFGGRVYARTGGVSFAVKTVVNRIAPSRLIKLKAKKFDGVKACKAILDKLAAGEKIDFNFIEGMGCIGGCVGGPRTNIDKQKGKDFVNEFAEDSLILTPFDNLNVMKILKQLGLNEISEITESNYLKKILTRESK